MARLPDYEFVYLDDHEQLIDQLRGEHFDLALNLCDTGYRNEWLLERNVPAFLEMLGIPYTGADPMAISLGTDKAIMRALGVSMGIPVPNEIYVDLTADPPLLPTVYPALVKPNSSGGSFGVTEQCVVNDPAEAEAYMRWLAPQLEPPEALIQDFLTGDEYTLGLIGNPSDGFTVLPPLAIDYSGLDPDLPPVLTYGSKADPESPYWNKISFRQAQLDEVTWSQMVDHAMPPRYFAGWGFAITPASIFAAAPTASPDCWKPTPIPRGTGMVSWP